MRITNTAYQKEKRYHLHYEAVSVYLVLGGINEGSVFKSMAIVSHEVCQESLGKFSGQEIALKVKCQYPSRGC